MTDQPAAGTPDSSLPDKADAPPVAGNVTVEGHGKYTGRDDNSINVTVAGDFIYKSGTTRRLTAVEEYLTAVREYCANLPYLTLHDIRPPKTLDEVYVPLKARPLPRKDEAKSKDEQERLEREAFRLEPLSIAEVMQQHEAPHVLILGEPGAGKSTLLRQMAERAWDKPDAIGLDERHLPLLVPLRLLALASGALDERLSDVLKNEMALPRALPDGFLDEWPKQTGVRWLILLDALDEVPDSERARLMQWLKGQLPHLREHCVVVTSRPTGYKDDFDAEVFSHYDLQAFTPEQTGDFARKWFSDKADAFLQELDPIHVGDLRGTPLLFTIAAKVFSEHGMLPKHRSSLYVEFVRLWLEEANQDNRLNIDLGMQLSATIDQHIERLEHLALRMTEDSNLSNLNQMQSYIAEFLQREEGFTLSHARNSSKTFVEIMARRSAVLTQRDSTFQFVHPNFCACMTARAIVRDCQQNLDSIWIHAVARWRESDWREVTLFILDTLSDAGIDVTDLLKRLSSDEDADALFFIGTALSRQANVENRFAEDIVGQLLISARKRNPWELTDVINSVTVLSGLPARFHASNELLMLSRDERIHMDARRYIVDILGELGRSDDLLVLACDDWLAIEVRHAAVDTLGRLKLFSQLLVIAENREVDTRIRVCAAEKLSSLKCQEKATRAWLVVARDNQLSSSLRLLAIEKLGNFGHSGEAIAIWSKLAFDELEDPEIRVAAAEMLEDPEEAGQAWLNLACQKYVMVGARVKAATALIKLGRLEQAVQAWVALASDMNMNADMRLSVLAQLGNDDTLLSLIQDESIKTRAEIAKSLKHQEYEDEVVLTWLVLARNNLATKQARARAIVMLRQLKNSNALLMLVCDNNVHASLRAKAVYELAQLGYTTEAELGWLALAHDPSLNANERRRAIVGLGELNRNDEVARAWLALACDTNVKVQVRVKTAMKLSQRGYVDDVVSGWLGLAHDANMNTEGYLQFLNTAMFQGHLRVLLNALLPLLQDEQEWIRREAGNILEHFGMVDAGRLALLALVRDENEETSLRMTATRVLGRLKDTNDLLALAYDETITAWVRGQAAETLGPLGWSNEAALVLLELALYNESEDWLRKGAADALVKMGRNAEALSTMLLSSDKVVDAKAREEAVMILDDIGGSQVIPILNQITETDPDKHVREAVRDAAARICTRLGIDDPSP